MQGNYLTTRDMLLSTPIPAKTNTYKPVTHQELMDLTLNSIYSSGFKVDKEVYRSAGDGQIANARYTIKDIADSEMQLEIGWQNSYNKTLSLKFAIGTRILVCENGCVHGDFGAFKKKHSGNVQEFAPKTIIEYIKSAGDVFQQIQKEREFMKGINLTKRQKAEIAGRMMIEEDFLAANQFGIIAKEINKPTYDYNSPDSLWEMYNHTTFAMKDTHPFLWMGKHIDAHKFFVGESNMVRPAVIAVESVESAEMPTDISPNQLHLFAGNEN